MNSSQPAETMGRIDAGRRRPNAVSPRAGALAWLVAAGVALCVTALAGTVAPALVRHGDPMYAASGVAMAVVDALVLVGVLALAGAGTVRNRRLGQVAFLLAIVGSAGVVVAEVLLRVNTRTGNAAFNVVGPMQSLGFIGVGVGMILGRTWTSWRRFVVLLTGVYVPAVLIPALAASGGENLPALAGYHALIGAVGIAFWQEAARRD